ncbi:Eco57I restriction-modification methylase domain-containing protein [Inediibacterium massiliense]|uniref:Eco57I restriction-modification methylase domain-containing protein n=1 Tax=Inediibacterium massiliense TaxID=1658111 RepID=UPI0006B49249|nr:TaqI-like C-terminal specificity domain-containing protein [Inediibacterium massiliense]
MEKTIQTVLKQMKSLDQSESDHIIELCKIFFLKYFGKNILNQLGMNVDEKLHEKIQWDTINDSYFNFTIFSKEYEKTISSKQKEKTGSFYTPDYIVDYIVEGSLLYYFEKKTGCVKEKIKEFLKGKEVLEKKEIEDLLYWIDKVKIIDIACGTGLFLIGSFQKIFKYKKRIYESLCKKTDDFLIKKYIVENNLFGVDIQKNPIIISKLVLFSLVYANEKRFIQILPRFNMIQADSLTEDAILKWGKFHIVLGNPPYFGEKGNKSIFDSAKETSFGKKYYEGKMDYFYFFIYRAMEILENNGILSYITTNYFLTADGACKLRNFIQENTTFLQIINFNEYEIFKSAKGQHNMIFFLSKGYDEFCPIQIQYIMEKNMSSQEIYDHLDHYKSEKIKKYTLDDQRDIYGQNGHIFIEENNDYKAVLEKIYKKSACNLESLCHINQGIVSGADKVTKEMLQTKISPKELQNRNMIMGQGIFVLSKEEVISLGLLQSSYIKPMYKNSDIQRYKANINTDKYILYILDDTFIKTQRCEKILQYLLKYKPILEKRRETLKGTRKWYALQWPRKQEIFEKEKIIVPQRAKKNKFAFHNGSWYASADVYFLTKKDKNIDLKVLLGLLNSKIMYFWLYNRGKRKGQFLELYATPLKHIPILWPINTKDAQRIKYFTNKMIGKGENHIEQQNIDQIFYRLYDFTQREIKMVEDLYGRNMRK